MTIIYTLLPTPLSLSLESFHSVAVMKYCYSYSYLYHATNNYVFESACARFSTIAFVNSRLGFHLIFFLLALRNKKEPKQILKYIVEIIKRRILQVRNVGCKKTMRCNHLALLKYVLLRWLSYLLWSHHSWNLSFTKLLFIFFSNTRISKTDNTMVNCPISYWTFHRNQFWKCQLVNTLHLFYFV